MADYTAGSASVSVTPDLRGFQTSIEEELEGLDGLFAKAGDKAGKSFTTAFQDDLRASFTNLPEATVKASADTTGLDTQLDEATAGRTAEVTADADTAKAGEALSTVAAGRTATVEADADTTAAGTQLETVARPRKTTVTADADTTAAEAQLTALTEKSWTVTVKEKLDKVDEKLPSAGATLAGIGALGLAPEVAGLAAGVSGLGISFAAAGVTAAAFGAIAKPMFADVATAQKALTKAQDDYAKADNSADRVKALQAEAAATAKLTPAEKELLTELTSLEGAWKKLSQAEQPAVGAAIAPWLQTASDGMRLLKPLITDGANALELLGNEADAAIKSPFWDKFSTTLGTTGEIALQSFGEAAGHVADGLAHLFVTFAPDIDKLPPLIDKVAVAFDGWAKSVDSKGLDDFLTKTFSPSNLAALKTDGESLVTLLKNLGIAAKDMSGLAFDGVTNVLKILGSLTPTEIEALTGLFLAIKGITAVSSAVSAISGIVSGIKGLFGSGGTAAGEEGGAAAATAFTTSLGSEVTAELPEVFTAIGTEGATEAGTAGTAFGTAAATAFGVAFGAEDAVDLTAAFTALGAAGGTEAATAGTAMGTAAAAAFGTAFGAEDAAGITAAITAVGTAGATEAGAAGTAWGTAAATAFGTAFGAEDAIGITAGMTAVGIEGATEAGVAGAAMGSAMAAAFTAAFDSEGVAEIGTSLAGAGIAATIAAGLAGAALGGALGLGFKAGLDLSGAKAAVGTLVSDAKAAVSGSGAWLTPAGSSAADGFGTGFLSQAATVKADVAQLKTWVTSALPDPAAWLSNIGVDVVQGMINGVRSMGSALETAILDLIPSPIRGVVTTVLGLPAFASGTPSAPAGWALVGEQGPELVRFSGGEQVKTNAASMSMLSGMASTQSLAALSLPSIAGPGRLPGVNSPLRGGQLQLQVTYVTPSGDAIAGLVQGFQFHINGNFGGDAQAALGYGPVRLRRAGRSASACGRSQRR